MIRIGITALAISGVVLFAGFTTSTDASAEGCRQWSIGGYWTIRQTNGYEVTMSLSQSGTTVKGSAQFDSRGYKTTKGSINGSVDRSGNINLLAGWGTRYIGGVGSDAFIGGSTSDGGNAVGWRGDRRAVCAELPIGESLPRTGGDALFRINP
jgi:hypothetical protein